jgi:hypothetical protein
MDERQRFWIELASLLLMPVLFVLIGFGIGWLRRGES